MNRAILRGLCTSVFLASTACASPTPWGGPPPPLCTYPPLPALIYPDSGARVPVEKIALVFNGVPATLAIVGESGEAVQEHLAPAAVPNPLPSPHAPVPAGAHLTAFAVKALKPGLSYWVRDTTAASGACASRPLGWFTVRTAS